MTCRKPPNITAYLRSSSLLANEDCQLCFESIFPLPAETLECVSVDENVPSTFDHKEDDSPGSSSRGDRPVKTLLLLTDEIYCPSHTLVQFHGQMLRAYPKMLVQKDQLPPVIHLQMSTRPPCQLYHSSTNVLGSC